jgi:poly(A) polymerase
MRLVPNLNTFKIALRCIKLWATKKAIYSNVMGFLGGVAWAILVARICQFYPNASASVVIGKFFNLLKAWNWNQPVLLQHIPDGPPLSSGLRPWKQNQNRNHRMPVITPSYPSMCATHNVTISTQRIILGEFNMAAQTVAKIMDGKLPWAALFQPHTFFQNYKYYLQVIVSGDSHEAFLKWSGYVEAKLRQLVTKLEAVDAIALVHPFVDGFNSQYTCSNPDDVWAATHGQIIPKNKRRPGTIVIHTKVFYIGLYIRMRPGNVHNNTGRKKQVLSCLYIHIYTYILVEGSRTLDLTEPIGDFTRMLKGWSEFNRYHMGIVVENVRRDQLPETVRPQRDVAISKRSLSKVKSAVFACRSKVNDSCFLVAFSLN